MLRGPAEARQSRRVLSARPENYSRRTLERLCHTLLQVPLSKEQRCPPPRNRAPTLRPPRFCESSCLLPSNLFASPITSPKFLTLEEDFPLPEQPELSPLTR